MRVFVFRYEGYYLGGTCIVIAKNVDEAKQLLKNELRDEFYESLELEEEYVMDGSTLFIYDDDGDY